MVNKNSLIIFPCLFPLKIVGVNHPDLIPEVVAIIMAYCPHFDPVNDVQIKNSKANNYLAVTATILAESQTQLDNIYHALNKHELIKITI